MTYTEEQVVAIVLEVIRRLQRDAGDWGLRPCTCGGSAHRSGPSAASEGGKQAESLPGAAEAPPGELALAERVISQRLVAGRLEGVRRVVVGPRAVVTPLVRDELKRRRIELVRRAAG